MDATDTSWVDEGVNFGSRYVAHLKKPVIAMAWDSPVSSLAAGATRFVLERQFGYPVTVIRTVQLGSIDLSKFNVLILPPAGGYSPAVIPEAAVTRLKAWVTGGGTLVGVEEGVTFLSDKRVGLLDIQQEDAFRDAEPKKPDAAAATGPRATRQAHRHGSRLLESHPGRKGVAGLGCRRDRPRFG